MNPLYHRSPSKKPDPDSVEPVHRQAVSCFDLATIHYREAYDLQLRIHEARRSGSITSDVILLLEHHPVFTLGKQGGRENLTVSENVLTDNGISVVHVERGGNITYHGPGQLVCYPILHLENARLKVVDYVERLEEVMIRTAWEFGVQAERNSANRGVWVGKNKLGSIGIAIRRGICFHGFAFNVNLAMEPFGWINPCGLKGVSMTSLEREGAAGISVDAVRGPILRHLEDVLNRQLIIGNRSDLGALLDTIG